MVSVIIPCYNCAKTITRTLQSLERQKYQEFEVVVVNDGSSDNTQEVVEAYQKESGLNINLIVQENSGVSIARNEGIKQSNGEYICFLDADDEYDQDFIYIMSKSIMDNKLDFSVCRFRYQNEMLLDGKKENFCIITKYDAIEMFRNKRANRINMWSFFYKKSLIIDNSIWFSDNLKYGEDTEFVCKYLFHCNRGGASFNSQLYIYYIEAGSAMHRYSYDRIQNIRAFINIAKYWRLDDNWNDDLGNYLVYRSIWAVAKDFAISNSQLFKKLIDEYDVSEAMDYLSQYSDEKSVKLSAKVYCIDKNMFRFLVLIYSLISGI